MRPLKVLLVCVGVAIASIAATAWVLLVFLAPQKTAAHRDGATRVPFSEFVAELDAGRGLEIRNDGDLYAYSLKDPDGKPVWREAVGPKADLAQAERLLRPADSSKAPPKIIFGSQ